MEQLREENQRMRQGQGASPENEELLAELEKLAAANAALQREAEEQAALAKKAEQERQTSVAAARNLQPRNSRMRSSRRLTGERTPCAMRTNTSRRALSVSLKRSDRVFPGGL